jgi:Fe-S oxidoreductase
MGVYEEPRRILSKMGLDLVEMESRKENAWCCGSGGGVKSAFKEMALETARERVRHAQSISADILLSACPFCKLNLSDGAKGEDIEVLDLVELLDRITN